MLPKGLYDALPWMYMAIGAVTAAVLNSDIKYLPALLFVAAGMLVFAYRRLARQIRHAEAHARPVRVRH